MLEVVEYDTLDDKSVEEELVRRLMHHKLGPPSRLAQASRFKRMRFYKSVVSDCISWPTHPRRVTSTRSCVTEDDTS